MWPSGRATVFGTVDRRFESYHPSHFTLDKYCKHPGHPLAQVLPQFLPQLGEPLWRGVSYSNGGVLGGRVIGISNEWIPRRDLLVSAAPPNP